LPVGCEGLPEEPRKNPVYGADGVSYADLGWDKLKRYEADPESSRLGTCMVKKATTKASPVSLR
jgi:hypothetical protein